MIPVLAAEPFWLPLAEILRLTDRQAWEIYLWPHIQRQRRSGEGRGSCSEPPSGPTGPCEVIDDQGRPVSPESALWHMANAGLMGPDGHARVREVIEQRRRWMEEHGRDPASE